MDTYNDPILMAKRRLSPWRSKAKAMYERREEGSEPRTVQQIIQDRLNQVCIFDFEKKQCVMPEKNFSTNPTEEYCMSDEFIEQLDKKAKLYLSKKKQLSKKEIVANGFKYMTEEALTAFRDYLARNDFVEGHDFKFGEVVHHCFTVDKYNKVFCHYNFTVEMKKNDEEVWNSSLYFAEAKLMDGVKYYFCTPIKITDDGPCSWCKNQCVNDLKHPRGGGYEKGDEYLGSWSDYPNADSSDDEELGMWNTTFFILVLRKELGSLVKWNC